MQQACGFPGHSFGIAACSLIWAIGAGDSRSA
jgi:hypothetical protein